MHSQTTANGRVGGGAGLTTTAHVFRIRIRNSGGAVCSVETLQWVLYALHAQRMRVVHAACG